MQKINISIFGCGWLGFPLAQTLLQHNFAVKGSTTSEHKLALLGRIGIEPYLVAVDQNAVVGNLTEFLHESEILIINIPPRLRGTEKENFILKIQTLLPFIESSSVKKVLFVSSISVYSDADDVITEETIPNPATASGRQLLEVEQLLMSNPVFKTSVVRFGGLIGPGRHPVHFLSGKQNLNPDAPINLIHLSDCIAIIVKLIERNVWHETLNAVTPFHPCREQYYVEKAKMLNLALPTFNHEHPSTGKTVDSSKLTMLLDYDFLEPQL